MTARDDLARIIRLRYDESPPGKWPMEDSLAEFILRNLSTAGYALVKLPESDAIPTDFGSDDTTLGCSFGGPW